MIVVCPNTVVSKLGLRLDRRPRGRARRRHDAAAPRQPRRCSATSTTARWTTRQRTILVDSAQLESGEPLTTTSGRTRPTRSRRSSRRTARRNPGADVDKLTDEDLLREAMNTIGKKGKLGEHIRCVVSVAMLTEGWDANTVTHILGIRAVPQPAALRAGRRARAAPAQLRRQRGTATSSPSTPRSTACRSRSSRATARSKGRDPPRPAIEVRALARPVRPRDPFPKLDGYRVELPDEPLEADFDDDSRLHVDQRRRSRSGSKTSGVVGATSGGRPRTHPQRAATAGRLRDRRRCSRERVLRRDGRRRRAVAVSRGSSTICRRWLDECVTTDRRHDRRPPAAHPGTRPAAEKVVRLDRALPGQPRRDAAADHPPLRPEGIDRRGPLPHPQGRDGSAADEVAPQPRRARRRCRATPGRKASPSSSSTTTEVAAYVKNERLGFTIPYVHEGRTPRLRPRLPRAARAPSPTTSSAR